jgi:hypothetical protein
MRRRWVGWLSLVALAGGAAVACGGKSENDGGASASAGESGDGGSAGANGGSAGTSAGTSGSAGTNGGTSTTGGTGGSAGCSLPPDPGPCEAAIRRYAFDPPTGLCLPFVYGGCGGNINNFETAEACYDACGGQGEIDPTPCAGPAECQLMSTRCCGGCDPPTAENIVAARRDHAGAVHRAMGCDVVDCVPCDPPAPNPWLFATCSAGRCIAKDARETELTECTQASDCVLRGGLGCCEACNTTGAVGIVSVNASVDVEPWLCGSTPIDCDACTLGMNYFDPTCNGMRCDVVPVSPPPD